MLHVQIITIGKLDVLWKDIEQEYQKRLSVYLKLSMKEEKEVAFQSESEKQVVLEKEAQLIEKHLGKQSKVVVLDIKKGRHLSSEDFAVWIDRTMQETSHIDFVIGGPLGVHESIIERADSLLSLSDMTFTHQIARILLQEQLYRAFTIINNKPYHYGN